MPGSAVDLLGLPDILAAAEANVLNPIDSRA
jgi:hypothetical protein